MFNPMQPHELMLAVAQVLRSAARSGGAADEFGRSQLLSAYSVARHLAAEQAAAEDMLAWLAAELESQLRADDRPFVAAARQRIRAARSGPQVGAAVGDLLDQLGDDDRVLCERVHRVLAEMADREVDVLAGAL